MALSFKCEEIVARDLKPGDLFSTSGSDYWNRERPAGAVGERVYVRTDAPAEASPDLNETVFRITIEGGP